MKSFKPQENKKEKKTLTQKYKEKKNKSNLKNKRFKPYNNH